MEKYSEDLKYKEYITYHFTGIYEPLRKYFRGIKVSHVSKQDLIEFGEKLNDPREFILFKSFLNTNNMYYY